MNEIKQTKNNQIKMSTIHAKLKQNLKEKTWFSGFSSFRLLIVYLRTTNIFINGN